MDHEFRNIQNMTSHKAAFDIYQVIAARNMHLADNNIVEAIIMGFIIMEPIVEGKSTGFISKMCLTYPNCMSISSQ